MDYLIQFLHKNHSFRSQLSSNVLKREVKQNVTVQELLTPFTSCYLIFKVTLSANTWIL
jgi:hypothetical protein